MYKNIIAGVLGAGRIGKFHIENNLLPKGIKIKKICDLSVEHLKAWPIIETNKIELTTNEDELFNDQEINAIFIFSSTDKHLEHILKASEKVKYIFCEKPLSKNLTDSLKAWEFLKDKDVNIQVGFNRRFDPSFAKLKVLAKQKVGEKHILKITSRDPEPPSLDYVKVSGGIFMDMAIHDFDMARFVVGSEVDEINVMGSAMINNEFTKYDDIDTATMQLKFANGCFGLIDISRQAVYGYDQRIELLGSEGVIIANNQISDTLTIATKNNIEQTHPPHFFIDRYKEAYSKEFDAFIKAFNDNQQVEVTFEDCLKAELIAAAAKESFVKKTTVKIKQL